MPTVEQDELKDDSQVGSQKAEWLKAESGGRPIDVDREANVIHGYVVAQEGPFKSEGRGEFDGKALRSILKLMKAEPNGLKSRLGHPTMSDDGIGKYLGRAKKPWIDKLTKEGPDGVPVEIEIIRADLHLDPSSFDTPSGNLGKYVLDRAESDSDSFSSSLVLTTDMEYRLDNKGRPKVDDAGNELPPLWRPTALHASDVVDTGDAVDSFLSIDALPDVVVRRGCELLDQQFRGKSRKFIDDHIEKWKRRYLDMRFGEEKPEPIATEPVAEPVPPPEPEPYDPSRDADKWRIRECNERSKLN